MMRRSRQFFEPDALIAAAALRKGKGRRRVTRHDLAREIRIAELTLRSVLNGQCPNLKSIKKVASKLGCTVEVKVSRVNGNA